MPLEVARSGDLANYSSLDTNMVLIVQLPAPAYSARIYGEIEKASQQGISSEHPHVAPQKLQTEHQVSTFWERSSPLAKWKRTSMCFSPSRTKRVLSQGYGPLIILNNPDA